MQMKLNTEFTEAQNQALWRKYGQHHSGYASFGDFYASAIRHIDGLVMVRWCGMWLGIESDGHAHS